VSRDPDFLDRFNEQIASRIHPSQIEQTSHFKTMEYLPDWLKGTPNSESMIQLKQRRENQNTKTNRTILK
jgi:hypothetical protein